MTSSIPLARTRPRRRCKAAAIEPFNRAGPAHFRRSEMSWYDNLGSDLGAIAGGIVGAYFGGPEGAAMGAKLGAALGNEVQQDIGDATKSSADNLSRNHGMSPETRDQIHSAVDDWVAQNYNSDVSPDDQQAVRDYYPGFQNLSNEMSQWICSDAVQNMGDMNSKPTGHGGTGGGWLQAIAKAMGQTLGEKASQMVNLSQEMSNLQGNGGSSDQQNAQLFNEDMTQFQATSQEYSILQNTFTTAIKSLGEALDGMARKQ
jgi:uncharacterized protein YcfJ